VLLVKLFFFLSEKCSSVLYNWPLSTRSSTTKLLLFFSKIKSALIRTCFEFSVPEGEENERASLTTNRRRGTLLLWSEEDQWVAVEREYKEEKRNQHLSFFCVRLFLKQTYRIIQIIQSPSSYTAFITLYISTSTLYRSFISGWVKKKILAWILS